MGHGGIFGLASLEGNVMAIFSIVDAPDEFNYICQCLLMRRNTEPRRMPYRTNYIT